MEIKDFYGMVTPQFCWIGLNWAREDDIYRVIICPLPFIALHIGIKTARSKRKFAYEQLLTRCYGLSNRIFRESWVPGFEFGLWAALNSQYPQKYFSVEDLHVIRDIIARAGAFPLAYTNRRGVVKFKPVPIMKFKNDFECIYLPQIQEGKLVSGVRSIVEYHLFGKGDINEL